MLALLLTLVVLSARPSASVNIKMPFVVIRLWQHLKFVPEIIDPIHLALQKLYAFSILGSFRHSSRPVLA